MAYIAKLTSCRTILAAITRTFKPSGSSWIIEAIEDIGWAIQAIGYHAGLEKKQTAPPYLTVKNNRAKIPCDVERIIAVEQLVPRIITNNNILNPDGTTPPQNTTDDNCPPYTGVKMRLGADLTGYGLAHDNPRTTLAQPAAPYYNLNTDYVITEFETGLIKLHYVGFATDDKGFPRVIDDADYKLALQWYCFQNMILKGYKNPEISWKQAFELWEMYRLRAENAVKVQSLDGAERFLAGWGRYTSGIEIASDFFMHMEQPEMIA